MSHIGLWLWPPLTANALLLLKFIRLEICNYSHEMYLIASWYEQKCLEQKIILLDMLLHLNFKYSNDCIWLNMERIHCESFTASSQEVGRLRLNVQLSQDISTLILNQGVPNFFVSQTP